MLTDFTSQLIADTGISTGDEGKGRRAVGSGSCGFFMDAIIPAERIATSILWVRKQKVILDRDLSELYGVETRALKQAVRRNIERFPPDFMFLLSSEEVDTLVSQSVIPSKSSLMRSNNSSTIHRPIPPRKRRRWDSIHRI